MHGPGDGNFHTFIYFDPSAPEEVREAHRLASEMVRLALELDGTCTGEHGVGVGKSKYLEAELGRPAVDVMRRIKRELDPQDILNPGKVGHPKKLKMNPSQ